MQNAEKKQAQAEKTRVVLVGRVGRLLTFKETTKGLLAKFPLAEHLEDGATRWHTVTAFGPKAEMLRERLMVGQEVKVVGYLHERQAKVKTKGGMVQKTVQEIYLAAPVKRMDKPG